MPRNAIKDRNSYESCDFKVQVSQNIHYKLSLSFQDILPEVSSDYASGVIFSDGQEIALIGSDVFTEKS